MLVWRSQLVASLSPDDDIATFTKNSLERSREEKEHDLRWRTVPSLPFINDDDVIRFQLISLDSPKSSREEK
jgi:ribosome-binding factor A